ncbi:MAG: hypothetical protein NTW14_10995 [bacterium]|nr:hypothetical protein [bacterium]
MIGFFIVRRMVELCLVSTATREHLLNVFSCQAHGKNVTQLNGHKIWELYNLDQEILEIKKPGYIANQFIHAYTSIVVRDASRNWSDVFVVSDYDRNDCIWRIPIAEIRRIFLIAAKDYPQEVKFLFNPKKGDYDIETN